MAIDNIELIKPLLEFKDDSFHQLLILKRKKDFPDKLKNAIQSVRTIKSYCITSIEYLEDRYEEIKMLCEVFQARAYIHVCSQNHKDVALNMINEIINRVKANQHNQKNVFDSVVGQLKVNEKRWIIDVDTKDKIYIAELCATIALIQPYDLEKIITFIPTKNGCHIITKPFNLEEFRKIEGYKDVEIQKRNPTLLYFPNSLENI